MTLDINTVKTVSVIVIGVLVLLAILAATLIRKILGKVITIVIVLGLAVTVYWQRDALTSCAQECQCTFFGQTVEIPENDLVTCAS